MKAYQKPAMLVLSISANDMLCSGCGYKMKESEFKDVYLLLFDNGANGNKDGRVDWNEVFSSGDTCEQGKDTILQYCKFLAESSVAIWS